MWSVYVVQHSISKQIYIGVSNCLERRLLERNARRQKATRRQKGKWAFVYLETYRSEHDAKERELKLKNHGRAKQELIKRISKSLLA
ncbi:MAG: hypothetical protein Greene101415_1122 [Parcubacteria group bacterium Greene1014_15]|nr:MAG: hypothetical protein Greene101415_1122 [Parcubacteria group bacterium Greene1014_15]